VLSFEDSNVWFVHANVNLCYELITHIILVFLWGHCKITHSFVIIILKRMQHNIKSQTLIVSD